MNRFGRDRQMMEEGGSPSGLVGAAYAPGPHGPGECETVGCECALSRRIERELHSQPLSLSRIAAVLATVLAARGIWADEEALPRLAGEVAAAGADSGTVARALQQLGYRCEVA